MFYLKFTVACCFLAAAEVTEVSVLWGIGCALLGGVIVQYRRWQYQLTDLGKASSEVGMSGMAGAVVWWLATARGLDETYVFIACGVFGAAGTPVVTQLYDHYWVKFTGQVRERDKDEV